MAKPVDYKELYRVQDKILDIIFSEESIFYLTGGTCINRFYSEKRYSDDLDFFTSDNNLFRENIRRMYNIFGENKISIEQVADSKDFVRIIVDDILKVDFINDRTFYYGKTLQSEKGHILDNAMNMLANKLSAVIGRDEPKDIFDLFLLSTLTELTGVPLPKSPVKKKFLNMIYWNTGLKLSLLYYLIS